MQFCTSCGRQILPAARFCTDCGMPVQATAGAAPGGRPGGLAGPGPGGQPDPWAAGPAGPAGGPAGGGAGVWAADSLRPADRTGMASEADPFDYLYARPKPDCRDAQDWPDERDWRDAQDWPDERGRRPGEERDRWPGDEQDWRDEPGRWQPSPAGAWPHAGRPAAGGLREGLQPPGGYPHDGDLAGYGAASGPDGPDGPRATRGRGGRHGRFGPLTVAAMLVLAVAVGVTTVIYLHGAAQPSATAANGQPIGSGPGGRASDVAVLIGPAAARQAGARAAARLISAYFAAINRRDYAAYRSLLAPGSRQGLTRRAFSAGYASTRDSLVTLRALRARPRGGRAASVTFTSHQRPADSPVRASCTRWHVTLFLVPARSGYLVGTAPASYHAAYRRCR